LTDARTGRGGLLEDGPRRPPARRRRRREDRRDDRRARETVGLETRARRRVMFARASPRWRNKYPVSQYPIPIVATPTRDDVRGNFRCGRAGPDCEGSRQPRARESVRSFARTRAGSRVRS
jgi:hypothetical protein